MAGSGSMSSYSLRTSLFRFILCLSLVLSSGIIEGIHSAPVQDSQNTDLQRRSRPPLDHIPVYETHDTTSLAPWTARSGENDIRERSFEIQPEEKAKRIQKRALNPSLKPPKTSVAKPKPVTKPASKPPTAPVTTPKPATKPPVTTKPKPETKPPVTTNPKEKTKPDLSRPDELVSKSGPGGVCKLPPLKDPKTKGPKSKAPPRTVKSPNLRRGVIAKRNCLTQIMEKSNADLEEDLTAYVEGITFNGMLTKIQNAVASDGMYFYSGIPDGQLRTWTARLNRRPLVDILHQNMADLLGKFQVTIEILADIDGVDESGRDNTRKDDSHTSTFRTSFWTLLSRAIATHAATSGSVVVVRGATYKANIPNFWNTVEFPIFRAANPAVTITAHDVNAQGVATQRVIWPQ